MPTLTHGQRATYLSLMDSVELEVLWEVEVMVVVEDSWILSKLLFPQG